MPLELPPLRERDRDVLLLARHFLDTFSKEDGKAFKGFSPDAEAILLAYPWPGNVRQLQNVIRSIVVLNDGDIVTLDMLPRTLWGSTAPRRPCRAVATEASAPGPGGDRRPPAFVRSRTSSGIAIQGAIDACGGSIPRAAAALEVSPSTIYRRIEAWRAEETTK